MLLLILKSSACLAVFMLFYKLLLEKESIHIFKRFYLLGALVLAMLIPLITFTTYIETTPIQIPLDASEMVTPPYVPEHMFEEPTNYIPIVLWSIYGLGVLIFTIRFSLNLFKIINRIKHNPKFKNQSIIHVLLTDLVQPHTFLNYIFFNKTKYESDEIPKEVVLHEETHAKEKHALDILFIELLQIVFWFNPLLYFIKKDIKLNHEFLADHAVIKNGTELKNYQNTLLAFSSDVKEPQLANAINYSSIKKRFTVMKTNTSKTRIWIRSLVLLPLLAILIYSFSSNKTVEKYIASKTLGINYTARSIDIDVFENGTYVIDNHPATKETFATAINTLHQDITPEIRNRIINIHVNEGKAVSDEDVWFIYNSVIDYGFHRIVTYNQEIIRAKGNKPFEITSKTKNQKGASKEQIAEYNKLAKYYNSQSKDNQIIKIKDMKRIKYLYDLMTDKQKKQAEPYPNFPPPPAPPAKDMTQKQKKEYETMANKAKKGESYSYQYKNKDGKVVKVAVDKKDTIAPPPPPPPIPPKATKTQKEQYEKAHKTYYEKYQVKNGKVSEKSKLPPPPPPKYPLDHVIEMAKKDATFYYEGEKITSDKAISLLKNDSELNISTKDSNSKNPIVRITTNPVITDKNGKVITDIDSLSEVEKNINEDKVGYVRINGKVYYYSIKNKKISYFNRWGERVNKKGEPLKPN